MKISHTWLQEYFKDALPNAEALADLFTFHSFEIENIEEIQHNYNDGHCNDKIIDAKVLPDRAHFCLSYRGIAEEVHALTGLSLQEIDIEAYAPKVDENVEEVKINIEDEAFCRRYVSRRIENVTIGPSSEKVRGMLESMDGRAINTVVDASNLVMFDFGQPLHAFDADKVKGSLAVRAAKEGEMIMLLDGREVTLSAADHVIADDEGPLAIAGVKGGKRAEVTMETKNIIIESANFNPASVRKTAAKYNLRNESSKRFENEITPEIAIDGMKHFSAFVPVFSPEARFGPISDFYPHPSVKRTLEVSLDFISKKLGVEVPKDVALKILNDLNIEVEEKDGVFALTIPHHRLDLVIKEDIVEEVGRIYGYDKIMGTEQGSAGNSSASEPHPLFYITEKIKNILVEQGFSEAYLYALVSKGEIEVAYPLASDKKALRTNLSEGMLKALDMNARNADLLFLDSVKMFEIGKVFSKDKKSGELVEHTSLCVGIRRVKKVKGQTANEDIRQLREHLIEQLGANIVTACTIDDTGGLMMIKNKQIGIINNIDGVMELDLDALVEEAARIEGIPSYESIGFGSAPKVQYQPFSIYPFMVRDIAVFVPDSVKPEEIENIIAEKGTDLLIKHRLFDSFQKDDRTSYAFRMIFQSYEKTLTDSEVNPIVETISNAMKEKGWEVR
jgi:phenylalanyl-tRNA synthetase beta chain